MKIPTLAAAVTLQCLAAAAGAAGATPDSYDMLNGNTGSYNYWDETYTGSGCVTCDGAALSGGVGDLTDGIVATDNWNVVEAPPGNGPYVGWTIDPTITFHWNSAATVNAVTFYFDDADGNGGVSAPSSVFVNGVQYVILDPSGPAPFAFTAGNVGFIGNDLVVSLQRSNVWVFASEVAFDVMPVPEPQTGLLLLAGLAAVGGLARRRARP